MENLYEVLKQKTNSNEIHQYFSPGRINLIGEHIDYKDTGGNVVPAAISLGIKAYACKSKEIAINSLNFNTGWQESEVNFDNKYEPEKGFMNMILGAYFVLNEFKDKLGGISVALHSTIPVASGLSSSAALNVLIITILNDFYNLNLSPTAIALKAQDIENKYLGLQTGIMDQFIIANGKKDKFILLDTDSLAFNFINMPTGEYKLFVVNTNKPRELAASAYNNRVFELKQVANVLHDHQLTFEKLREVADEKYLDLIKNNTLRRRLKHVVTEIKRVELVNNNLSKLSGAELGAIMNAAHASLRDDYEVSCEEADWIHYKLSMNQKVFGSRIVGAGFGGCLLVIAHPNATIADLEFDDEYLKLFGLVPPGVYEFEITDGTKKV